MQADARESCVITRGLLAAHMKEGSRLRPQPPVHSLQTTRVHDQEYELTTSQTGAGGNLIIVQLRHRCFVSLKS